MESNEANQLNEIEEKLFFFDFMGLSELSGWNGCLQLALQSNL